ncbi:hypothetical protein [Dietzia timorensis]|uniref:hypothetical protein n=1 Tax=Dietzia timorensis TaxID=499555 RepID=UPI0012E7658E|nr:hypothetical protein [Dietzia timorensis]
MRAGYILALKTGVVTMGNIKDEQVDGDPCERSIVDALEMPESEDIEFEPGRLGLRSF